MTICRYCERRTSPNGSYYGTCRRCQSILNRAMRRAISMCRALRVKKGAKA